MDKQLKPVIDILDYSASLYTAQKYEEIKS